MKDVLIAWIAGSGKGTQARELKKNLWKNIQYFEPGSVFRAFGSNDNIIGNYTKQYTSTWRLLPDAFFKNVIWLVFTCLEEWNRLLVDGFPRMYSQKKMFDDIVATQNREFVVFNLELSDELAKQRLLNRKMCPVCSTTYSDILTPWITNCTEDWKELVVRSDDQSQDAIAQRFAAYYSDIKRVVDEYRQEGKVVDIDGTLPIEDITKIMIDYLELTDAT